MTFSITQRLDRKQYAKAMMIGLYKKPTYILSTLFGLALATLITLNYLGIIDLYPETPWLEIVSSAFLLLAPLLIVSLSVKQIQANPSFLNDMTFTFTNEGYSVEAATFNSNIQWAHILKATETGQYLILYHTKKSGNFIDRNKLTPEQLSFIKDNINKNTLA